MAEILKVRITGAKNVIANLTQSIGGVVEGAEEGTRIAAEDLLMLAKQITPVLTGDLEQSGRVIRLRGSQGRRNFAVTFGTDHAVFAHEQISPAGPRRLGRLSQEKDLNTSSPDGPVGGHFLSRPFNRKARGYLKFICDNALRNGQLIGGGKRTP